MMADGIFPICTPLLQMLPGPLAAFGQPPGMHYSPAHCLTGRRVPGCPLFSGRMFQEATKPGFSFWATVCKTVRPMLLDHCLSVTLVYCDQTVGWIKMKHGTEVGLDPGHKG